MPALDASLMPHLSLLTSGERARLQVRLAAPARATSVEKETGSDGGSNHGAAHEQWVSAV
ncbi:MAG: hypothetical protein OEO20_14130 [Gemmatimonadota bacterium]|nr:hypothetical protein [Gemmatimonadota bacterium]MDH3479430.1 hypothetical protein [Gemmatimonadota bacterium]MDH3571860.1 hypothetical protein [Gemmatimonadota bacterium]